MSNMPNIKMRGTEKSIGAVFVSANRELKNWQIVLISQVVILSFFFGALVLLGRTLYFCTLAFLIWPLALGYGFAFFLLYLWRVRDLALASLVFSIGLLVPAILLLAIFRYAFWTNIGVLLQGCFLAFALSLLIRFYYLRRWMYFLILILPTLIYAGWASWSNFSSFLTVVCGSLLYLLWTGVFSFIGHCMGRVALGLIGKKRCM